MDLIDRLEPKIAAVVRDAPIRDMTDLPAVRRTYEAGVKRPGEVADIVQSDHLAPGLGNAPEVRLRFYRPAATTEALPCLYWIHGGGFCYGNLDGEDLWVHELIRQVHCAVVSVDWRLAPENPFPAPMDDCYAGLAWTYGHAAEMGIDAARVAVGGSSSGAGSAASLALLARDRGEFQACYQLLIYPMLDDSSTSPSSYEFTDRRIWTREANVIAWRGYLGCEPGSPGVSQYAAAARAVDLTNLPPAYMAAAEVDILVDEDIDYAQRLLRAGVPTELHVYARAHHGCLRVPADSDAGRRMNRDLREALVRTFSAQQV